MGHLAYQPPLIYLNQLNEQVLTYLQKWDQGAEDHQELSKAERAKCLLSYKLRFDISSMIRSMQNGLFTISWVYYITIAY